MRWFGTQAMVLAGMLATGCNSSKPLIAMGQVNPDSTAPSSAAPASDATDSVATSELGTVKPAPGITKPSKPFIALPAPAPVFGGGPSTLLLEHAVPDSPVPLSEFKKQPVRCLTDFHLQSNLSAPDLEKQMGPPAQLADNEDPWVVYRLVFNQELWLHFSGPLQDRLDAADVVRGAEEGYTRDRVFSADKSK